MPKKDESRYIKNLKKKAKDLRDEAGCKLNVAQNQLANLEGYASWRDLIAAVDEKGVAEKQVPVPAKSLKFAEDEDVPLSDEDYDSLDEDEARELPKDVKAKIVQNLRILAKSGVEFSVFEPTRTGLKKHILDATQPVRLLLSLEEFHDYDSQGQGPEFKVVKSAFFVEKNVIKETTVSLYRPKTKKGDPRMWFPKLSEFAQPGDQVAIFVLDECAYLINLFRSDLADCFSDPNSKLSAILSDYLRGKNSVVLELLERLRELSVRPFPSLRVGDTGVGFTLETMLGIQANSSKEPDYKGIELKSGRGAKSRTTLFAQVADWTLSSCKKSSEILDRYGYEREDDLKLYCTVSTQKENTQGLSFIYDQNNDLLQEVHSSGADVAVWSGRQLRARLLEKHRETLWIQADSMVVDGKEHFQLRSAVHTKAPILSQFMPLIRAGVVTMDHLIKRNGATGRVTEKGPLFKIQKRDLGLLFPDPVTYQLS